MVNLPTQGEKYAELLDLLHRAQSVAAELSHLAGLNNDKLIAQGWLSVSELFRRLQTQITNLATRKMF